jgi:hypothetical protein
MGSAAEVQSIFATGANATAAPPAVLRGADLAAPGWQFEPAMVFNGKELLTHGRFPVWNPYVAYGTPWAAGMLPQPLFPLAILPAAFPSPRAINWFIVLRLFAAGVMMLLFLRLFLSAAPSLIGAAAFMFSGYFIIFLNIDHLSTEILLPAVFWSFEKLYRGTSLRACIPAALVIFLSIVSGMPESTFLMLVFGYAYWLTRVVVSRAGMVQQGVRFVTANLLGFGLAACLLLPFLEFLHYGYDSHRPSFAGSIPGLVGISDYRGLLLYVLPFLFGPFNSTAFKLAAGSGMYSYFGLSTTLFAGIAVASLFRREPAGARHRLLIVFFGAGLAFCLLKHWASPVVNWVGLLPMFNMIHYPKYIQPLASFSAAVLAATGSAWALRAAGKRETWLASLTMVACMFGLLLSYFLGTRIPGRSLALAVLPNAAIPHTEFVLLLAVFALGLLYVFGMTALLVNIRTGGSLAITALVVAAVCAEVVGNYFFPVYHLFGSLPAQARNPYSGAPYVRFLQSRASDHYRIFARDGLLFPNWASVFELSDVRYVYGVTYDKYLKFVQAFLLGDRPVGVMGELMDRFTGLSSPPYDFLGPLPERFLQLSSIRYLVSNTPFVSEASPLITEILNQNAGRIVKEAPAISRTAFLLEERGRDVLFQHPPSQALRLATRVPSDRTTLLVSPVLNPAVFGGCGDGVDFSIDLEANGKTIRLYQRYIDPKHNADERRWLDDRLDLGAWAGRDVALLFSTGPGPRGDGGCDWAGWGGLTFVGPEAQAHVASRQGAQSLFRPVYQADAQIYEYSAALPRAAMYYGLELAATADAALNRLRTIPDVWTRAVITDDPSMPEHLRSALHAMSNAENRRAEAAAIVSHESTRVRITADSPRPALVVLTDSNYPGWNAYVDGEKTPLLEANYLFRGVAISAGRHTIEFVYEPRSYAYGFAVSTASLLGIVFIAVRYRKKAVVPIAIAEDTAPVEQLVRVRRASRSGDRQ